MNTSESNQDETENLDSPVDVDTSDQDDELIADQRSIDFTPTASQPMRIGQFRISTLLSWTAVTCILMSVFRVDAIFASVDPNLPPSDSNIIPGLIIFAIFFLPPWTCIPYLIDRLLEKQNGLQFNLFMRVMLIVFVGVYSVAMLVLATIAFSPYWKGSKGPSWFYYTLDGLAGMSLWPVYAVGACLFATGVIQPVLAKRSPLIFLGALTCAVISFWYVLATLMMDFTNGEELLAVVPGACGVCYTLYTAIIWRSEEFTVSSLRQSWDKVVGWLAFLGISVLAKYPLATRFYEALPDDPPAQCFIVTAATKGHRSFVRAWFDSRQNRLLNDQLLTFWNLESILKRKLPLTHQWIRKIYNRVGPGVARLIVYRWQADCVYILLKPLELLARIISRASSR